MDPQQADKQYVHEALFSNIEEARAAMHDLEEAGLSDEQVALVLHHDKRVKAEQKPRKSDIKKGLLLGLGIGAVVGVLSSLLLARLGVLSGFFEQTTLLGLLGGMLFGGLGGGLISMGLFKTPLPKEEQPHPPENVLVTAKTADISILNQVENIFKKHHAVAVNS